jgi:hypothetical protein
MKTRRDQTIMSLSDEDFNRDQTIMLLQFSGQHDRSRQWVPKTTSYFSIHISHRYIITVTVMVTVTVTITVTVTVTFF